MKIEPGPSNKNRNAKKKMANNKEKYKEPFMSGVKNF